MKASILTISQETYQHTMVSIAIDVYSRLSSPWRVRLGSVRSIPDLPFRCSTLYTHQAYTECVSPVEISAALTTSLIRARMLRFQVILYQDITAGISAERVVFNCASGAHFRNAVSHSHAEIAGHEVSVSRQ